MHSTDGKAGRPAQPSTPPSPPPHPLLRPCAHDHRHAPTRTLEPHWDPPPPPPPPHAPHQRDTHHTLPVRRKQHRDGRKRGTGCQARAAPTHAPYLASPWRRMPRTPPARYRRHAAQGDDAQPREAAGQRRRRGGGGDERRAPPWRRGRRGTKRPNTLQTDRAVRAAAAAAPRRPTVTRPASRRAPPCGAGTAARPRFMPPRPCPHRSGGRGGGLGP